MAMGKRIGAPRAATPIVLLQRQMGADAVGSALMKLAEIMTQPPITARDDAGGGSRRGRPC